MGYAKDISSNFGGNCFCVDEMTSLQANEKRAQTKRPIPGQCGKEECQYTRHGTVCLTGNWDVVRGQFLHPTIEETRNNEDFAEHIDRLIKTGTSKGWVFVVDNLNTHCGEPLVRMVARHLGIRSNKLGEVTKKGILKDMESRRAFLTDPSHSIRVYSQAQLVVEPNRSDFRHVQSTRDAGWKFHVKRGSHEQVTGIYKVLQ